jgi:hydrogenase/urease accessory protein HupE
VRRIAALLVLTSVCLVATRASAHQIGLSTGDYAADAKSVSVKLVFATAELAKAVPLMDADGDGHVTALELSSAGRAIETSVLRRVVVTRGGQACVPMLVSAQPTEGDGIAILGRYACLQQAAALDVQFEFLEACYAGHRHVAHVASEPPFDDVLLPGHTTLSWTSRATPDASDESGNAPLPAPTATVGAFFAMGVEHILSGIDHLAFLVGLLLVRWRAKSLVATVTAFTLAHSLTLAVAAFGLAVPSARWIEPAIALSVAYVGAENVLRPEGKARWRTSFVFGLLHGFGFASKLTDLALSKTALPVALLAFNAGVEVGQLVAVAAALAVLLVLRKRISVDYARIANALLVAAGLVWFVQRVVARS